MAIVEPRYFNTVTIDHNLQVLTKKSGLMKNKIIDEIGWYLELPSHLRYVCPKFLGYRIVDDFAEYYIEYLDGKSVADILIGRQYSEVGTILEQLFVINAAFREIRVVGDTDLQEYYHNSLDARFSQLFAQDTYWRELSSCPNLYINHVETFNPLSNIDKLHTVISLIGSRFMQSIIHGDFCLSNVILDMENKVKLVDPKGRFIGRSIYGDPRYDLAKLRHSIHGNYEKIILGHFSVVSAKNQFSFSVEPIPGSLAEYVDERIEQCGYSLREIEIIEGFLFLLMLPLHLDRKDRQLAFLLIAARMLNGYI